MLGAWPAVVTMSKIAYFRYKYKLVPFMGVAGRNKIISVCRNVPFLHTGSSARFRMTSLALPEAPDRKRTVFLAGPPLFQGTWQV